MRFTRVWVVALIALMLISPNCIFRKKKPPLPVPAPPPIATQDEPPIQPVQVPEQPPESPVEQPLPAPQPPPEFEKKSPAERSPRVRPPSQRSGPAKPPAATAPQEETPAPQQPAPAGKLAEILTDEQKSEYRRAYIQSEATARKLIDSIGNRRLDPAQQDVLARIRSFLQQATEATTSDWSLAAQLAKRAELLAQDLANVLQ